LSEAPAPFYIYPTNSLSVAPDGTTHLIIEWYKVFTANVEPPRSMAVSHFEYVDGDWFYTDGTRVKSFPIRIEDSDPVIYKGNANLRPGNVAVLPDGRPCFGIWDRESSDILLALRSSDHDWKLTNLAASINGLFPGTYFNGQPQICVTPSSELIMVIAGADRREWAHPSSRLHVFRVAPESAEIIRSESIPKNNPDVPDWLPSIEKGVLGRASDDPFLTYISGSTGEGVINDAECEVRMVHLT
jgi:hypothetical protein